MLKWSGRKIEGSYDINKKIIQWRESKRVKTYVLKVPVEKIKEFESAIENLVDDFEIY